MKGLKDRDLHCKILAILIIRVIIATNVTSRCWDWNKYCKSKHEQKYANRNGGNTDKNSMTESQYVTHTEELIWSGIWDDRWQIGNFWFWQVIISTKADDQTVQT